jgi:four helix bundle protein
MGEPIRSYRDLVVWQLAVRLGLDLYRVTSSFPDSERFGLTSQIRRAAVSVASNIAEGYGRGARQEYIRYLRMSRGSLYEIETQLAFAAELGFMQQQTVKLMEEKLAECGRVLAGLLRSLDQGDPEH